MARPVVCGKLSLRMYDRPMGAKATASAVCSEGTRGRGSRAPLMVPKSVLGPVSGGRRITRTSIELSVGLRESAMTNRFGRVLFCATALAALVLAAVGAGPKGPRILENLLVDEKPEQPPAAGNPNNGKFDPANALAINEAEARACLGHEGGLSFLVLKDLGPVEARILASHGHGIAFDALANINQPTAEALAHCKSHLALNGIAQLGNQAAEALASCKGTLELKGLRALTSPALAAKLATQGKVELPHVQMLQRNVLEAFCTAPCDLYLPGLVHLQAHDAEALRHHQGVLDIDGLQNPPPDVLICILGNQGPIGLGATNDIGNPVPKAVCDALIPCQGSLCLNGLKNLATEEAKAIRDRTHRTDLDGLQALDLQTAIALRDCKSVITLHGVMTLNEEIVKVLLLRDRNLGPGLIFSANLAESLRPHQLEAIYAHPGLQLINELGP